MVQKQSLPINFAQGLDTKTDPLQVSPGKFLSLQNTIFEKGGLLQKRNGFGYLPSLPQSANYATTFNGNLTAIGSNLLALNSGTSSWQNKGRIQNVQLQTLPLIRSNLNQSQADTAISPNGLACTVFTDNVPSGGSITQVYKYAVVDSTTGQNVIAPTVLAATGTPRVFILNQYFVIVYTNLISAVNHLQFISINSANLVTTSPTDISTQYLPASSVAFNGYVINNALYLGYNATDSGGAVRVTYIDSTLTQHNTIVISGKRGTQISLSSDATTLFVNFYDSATSNGYVVGFTPQLLPVTSLPLTQTIASKVVLNLTTSAISGVMTLLYEVSNTYSYDSAINSNYISKLTVSSTGTVSTTSIIARSVGLASKSFVVSGNIYVLAAYDGKSATQSAFQPTYFLLDVSGNVLAKLAYSNGGGYLSTGLPAVNVVGTKAFVNYLVKDQIQAVNKSQGAATSAGIYSQTGINLCTFDFNPGPFVSAEIGANLNLSGGFLWSYDGFKPVEQNFHLWPDSVEAVVSASSGGLTKQPYYYQAVYEWSDNQGNVFRSAPSVPIVSDPTKLTTTVTRSATFSAGSTTLSTGGTTGFAVGQIITDTTTPASIPAGTYITAVGASTLTISQATAASGSGDIISATNANSATASFTAGSTTINVSSVAGFYVGQTITDATTPGNLTAQTKITAVGTSTLTINQVTAGAASSDTITTADIYSATVSVPTLRLTYKTTNPVKIVLYRWSQSQQSYFQITSLTQPILNDPTVDSVSFLDTSNDLGIVGNNLIYTTGGVVEDVGGPPTLTMTLFQSRLFLVDAEDPNLIWFSKQVIDATPVEMSDLLTIYVAPTTSAQGATGPITALSSVDDKLIIFKKNAIYYVTGQGPDATGANNQFSDPVYVTSTVGCTNQNSVVFMPQGLMFQSDKGIWLLDRNLDTKYIGAEVQDFNGAKVQSAVNVPGTNQVRFTLDSGVMLVYDYFYGQWGTFTGIPSVTSCLYQNKHTIINSLNQVSQETPGLYLDGSNPVLMSFKTSWFNLTGLQGYQRAFFFYFLAQYISPHKLNVQIAYDYAQSFSQNDIISPDNYSPTYGSDPVYGSQNVYGGPQNKEQWRVFFQQQRCQAFQIAIQEVFDASFGTTPGPGFTMSGLNLIFGQKSSFPTISAAKSVG